MNSQWNDHDATQHLDDGNEAAACDCFEEIATLEDEYDVQLLTDADKRRLDELQ